MRIIGGIAKGRILKSLRGYDVRPTPEKVRESLFQRLGDLEGMRFLDGFAGTGAMGLEALSRGVSRVVFVDDDRRACKCIEENLERIGFSGVQGWKVLPLVSKTGTLSGGLAGSHEEGRASWAILPLPMTRAIAYLERVAEVFDIIFLDPPYRSEAGLVALKRLAGSPIVGPGCRVFWEHPARLHREVAQIAGWRVVDTRIFGDTEVTELAWES